MSEQFPEQPKESSSSLDGIDAKKILAGAAIAGALGLASLIYKVANDRLKKDRIEGQVDNEDL
jgi:hypothetical protein